MFAANGSSVEDSSSRNSNLPSLNYGKCTFLFWCLLFKLFYILNLVKYKVIHDPSSMYFALNTDRV